MLNSYVLQWVTHVTFVTCPTRYRSWVQNVTLVTCPTCLHVAHVTVGGSNYMLPLEAVTTPKVFHRM